MPSVPAICSEMNGSCATRFIPNDLARSPTSWPIRPSPTMPECFAAQLHAGQLLLFPDAALHRRVGGRDHARERQHERHGQLRDADAVCARRVHDDDAAIGCGRDVDVVDAGSGAGDDLQLRRRGHQRGGHLRGAANDEGVGGREIASEFSAARPLRASMVHPGTLRSSSTADEGKLIGNDDVHDSVCQYNVVFR